jgi:predicted DNA-binding transcriptional regulator YafY
MRADRLVAILLMLQTKGRVTAAQVAEELEISERTARRDLDALGMAGIPVYSQQGRNGGWMLAGGGRTDLSGLSAAEARALFLVAGPASTATPELRAALRKLVRALPEPLRNEAEAAGSAIVVDETRWDGPATPRPTPPHLDPLQQAVIDAEQVSLGYIARDGEPSTRDVHPLGLATKGNVWYLVADTDAGMRTFRVDRVQSVERLGRPAVRPEGFDLAEAWQLVTTEVDKLRAPVRVSAVVDPTYVRWLRGAIGNRVRIGGAREDGWVEVEIRGHHPESVAADLAGFGGRIEVIEPAEVRDRLQALGEELVARYRP